LRGFIEFIEHPASGIGHRFPLSAAIQQSLEHIRPVGGDRIHLQFDHSL
jgi:hypothetical protein